MKKKFGNKVLVLNSNYYSIGLISFQDAFRILFKGNAYALNNDGSRLTIEEWLKYPFKNEDNMRYINTVSLSVAIPNIILLKNYDKTIRRKITINKRNIWKRDNKTCAYCGRELKLEEATMDHIIPQSKGGKDTWDNLVCCCKKCNAKKGDKSLTSLGWKLRFKPQQPTELSEFVSNFNCPIEEIPISWTPYIQHLKQLNVHKYLKN